MKSNEYTQIREVAKSKSSTDEQEPKNLIRQANLSKVSEIGNLNASSGTNEYFYM